MPLDAKTYSRAYYASHREELAERRKKRYQADPQYRDQDKARAMEQYRRRRDERIKARNGEAVIQHVRGYNRPRIFLIGGQSVLVRCVLEFADRLGRNVQTVTAWERRGVIPPPSVVDEMCRRWYTDRHIEVVGLAVKKYHAAGNHRLSELKRIVWEAWNQVSESIPEQAVRA